MTCTSCHNSVRETAGGLCLRCLAERTTDLRDAAIRSWVNLAGSAAIASANALNQTIDAIPSYLSIRVEVEE